MCTVTTSFPPLLYARLHVQPDMQQYAFACYHQVMLSTFVGRDKAPWIVNGHFVISKWTNEFGSSCDERLATLHTGSKVA